MAKLLSQMTADELAQEKARLESEALADGKIVNYSAFVALSKVKTQISKRESDARKAQAAERIRKDIEAQGERLKTLNILAKRSGWGL
jgi:hypothetical protein